MEPSEFKPAFNIIAELDALEEFVSNRNYEASYQQLLKILKASSIHKARKDEAFGYLHEKDVAYVANRFVAATFSLFMDEGFKLNQNGYEMLQVAGRVFSTIVATTPFKNADHVIRHLVGQSESGVKKETLGLHDFRKFMFLWSVYSEVTLPFENFINSQPDIMKYLIFNGLTSVSYVTEGADSRREYMLELLARDDFPLRLDETCLAFAGPVWMYTAYANTPLKHKAKIAINKAYRNWMLEHGIREPTLGTSRKLKDKPTVVIIVEQMTINHAVYRCRGKALESLKKKFHVVGMGLKDYVDEEATKVFDEFVFFESGVIKSMKKNVGKIIKQKPDMILYLSLGMQNLTVPLATMRLAPIQGCLIAHPTTSEMETQDYVFGQKSHSEGATEFSETMVLVPDGSFPFAKRGAIDYGSINERSPRNDENPDVIRIAIPSSTMKLNSVFFGMLQRISDRANKPVAFHFFPHVVGLAHRQLKADIESLLPNSVVHLPYAYDEYVAKVHQCHFHMSPFPFGNTNGNIDSTRVAVPIIAMKGDGIESVIDIGMLKRMGMPDWVVADDLKGYEELALSLIHDDEKRKSLVEYVKTIDLDSIFYETNKEHTFVDAVYAVYQKHELIQEREIKEIEYDDLMALGSEGEQKAS